MIEIKLNAKFARYDLEFDDGIFYDQEKYITTCMVTGLKNDFDQYQLPKPVVAWLDENYMKYEFSYNFIVTTKPNGRSFSFSFFIELEKETDALAFKLRWM